jgi:hypothetical protein
MPLFSALGRRAPSSRDDGNRSSALAITKIRGAITAHETTMALLTGTSGTGLKSTQFMTELFDPSSA